ncbi:MAG: glycosyltransferase [Thermodesulfobacteriota bacterium]|nr:glycosyltransferase [Thermodesulfobacteriota bacterium]
MNRSIHASGFFHGLNPSDELPPDRVSVIIATYNYGHFILDAIDSVLEQSVLDLEIIIVDDGSEDNTSKILHPYRKRLNYIYQKNAGLSAARNTGIANSTGEFIQFLDADDMLGPDTLIAQLRYLQRHPDVDIVVCRNRLFEVTSPDGHPLCSGTWHLFQRGLDLHLCYFNIAPPHAFLCRRRAIIETGWFDTRLKACEDYDFWLRAAVRGFVPHYNPQGLVYYRRHKESMSANSVNQFSHDSILHKRLSELLDEYPKYPEGRRLEGLLAFSSGAIVTAARLHGHQPHCTQDLIELALKRVQDAREIAFSGNHGWTIPMSLYCFRIRSCLSAPCFKDVTTAQSIHEALLETQGAAKGTTTPIGLMIDAVILAFTGSRRFILEIREIFELSSRFFIDSLRAPLEQRVPKDRLFQRLFSEFNKAFSLKQLVLTTSLLSTFLALRLLGRKLARMIPPMIGR